MVEELLAYRMRRSVDATGIQDSFNAEESTVLTKEEIMVIQ